MGLVVMVVVMIYELKIRDPEATPVSHWNQVPFLLGRDVIEFRPGLNVVYGGNGTGKSTLINALAALTHTWETNWPCVTKASVMRFNGVKGFLDGLLLEHDGSPARYLGVDPPAFAPTKVTTETLILKPDARTERKPLTSMSHGQSNVTKLVRFLKSKPASVVYKCTRRQMSGQWLDLYDVATESLKNKSSRRGFQKGQQTIILDEVDRSLDFTKQAAVWKQLRKLAEDHQVIVASHSPFSVYAPDAHYIETEGNYLRNSRLALAKLSTLAGAGAAA